MKIVVFDTETTSIEKPFVYNIGYTIYDTDTDKVLIRRDYVAEQIWHNRELFTAAYFADKREGYISRMRGKTCEMAKLGYITQKMCRDFEMYEVEAAYAHNCSFDDRVFTFNCEWFKIKNPFDTIPIYDTMAYAYHYIATLPEYQEFCDKHKIYTEKGHYPISAEAIYRYLIKDENFMEAHTALADADIELQILVECVRLGAEWNTEYELKQKYVPRLVDKVLEVKAVDGSVTSLPYQKITVYKEKDNKTKIILKNRPTK